MQYILTIKTQDEPKAAAEPVRILRSDQNALLPGDYSLLTAGVSAQLHQQCPHETKKRHSCFLSTQMLPQLDSTCLSTALDLRSTGCTCGSPNCRTWQHDSLHIHVTTRSICRLPMSQRTPSKSPHRKSPCSNLHRHTIAQATLLPKRIARWM